MEEERFYFLLLKAELTSLKYNLDHGASYVYFKKHPRLIFACLIKSDYADWEENFLC